MLCTAPHPTRLSAGHLPPREGFFSSPSSAWISHKNAPFAEKQKSPCSPYRGNKDRTNKFCGTTLFAVRKNDRSARCQHTACQITPALRQRILRKPFLPALGGPFADPLFAPLSALRDSLWMRCRLYFRFFGLRFELGIFIHQERPFVKNFFSPGREFFSIPAQRP